MIINFTGTENTSPTCSSCHSAKDSAISSEPESDWNEQTESSRSKISSTKESDLRPESDQSSTKKSSHRKTERSKSRRSIHANKPTIAI